MYTRWIKSICLLLLSSILVGFMDSCSEKSTAPDDGLVRTTIYSLGSDSVYYGVPMKFWTTFSRAVADSHEINWELGSGSILRRSIYPSDTAITADTVYVVWNRLPALVKDSSSNRMRYFDTVRVGVGGVRSARKAVMIENIFPSLDSIKVQTGFTFRPKGDSLYIRVHNGEDFTLRTYTTDLLRTTALNYTWPSFMQMQNAGQGDSVFRFKVAATTDFDQTGVLRITDGTGANRTWKMRFQTYQETGSLWIGTTFEMIKISGQGMEVFRTTHPYEDHLLVALNSGIDALFRAEDKNLISKYSTLGFIQQPERILSFYTPTAMTTYGSNLWVALEDPGAKTDSTKYRVETFNVYDMKTTGKLIRGVKGKVQHIVARPDVPDALWMVVGKDSGAIVLATPDSIYVHNDSALIGPKKMDWDQEKKVLWVTNGRDVAMLNATGKRLILVKGFGNVTDISAGGGVCWVVDPYSNSLVILSESQVGERDLLSLAPGERQMTLSDPVACAVVRGPNPKCWIAENGAGRVVLIDRFGVQSSTYTGMVSPRMLLVNQSN